jgi:AcrR family transcriptional regulator
MTLNKPDISKTGALMMMAQLSERSGTPVSTIKYYIRENLLPSGIKANRTTVYYDQNHINRLKTIKQLQDEGLTLRRIKFILKNQGETDEKENQSPSARRENIIDAAIPLFMENGLEMTSITDIVKAARISRNTFYREFTSKRDVFVASLDKMLKDMINAFNDDIRSKMTQPDDGTNKIWNFLGMRSSWTDFMHLLGATIVNDPPLLNKMLDDFIQLRAQQISKGFDQYIQKGFIRPVDTHLLGIIVLGIIDYCGRFIRSRNITDGDLIYQKAIKMLINGIREKEPEDNRVFSA